MPFRRPSISSRRQWPRPPTTPALALLVAMPLGVAAATPGASPGGFTCLIEPSQRVELRSAVEGRIEAITVERGSEVRRGQVLVELESGPERAALEAARYRAVMQGQLKTAESRRTAAQKKFERRDELVQEKFIAAQDRDDSAAEMALAEAGIVEAQDNRRLAELEQRRLQEAIEQRRIRSPINGVVTERLQHVGEIAQTGDGARAILKLAQVHPLRVEVVLPVAMLGKVRGGQVARVAAEAPLTGQYSATVAIVDRVVDSASGTFRVRLDLPNPRGDIPAGVKCSVQFAP